jgi:hypothetical protein
MKLWCYQDARYECGKKNPSVYINPLWWDVNSQIYHLHQVKLHLWTSCVVSSLQANRSTSVGFPASLFHPKTEADVEPETLLIFNFRRWKISRILVTTYTAWDRGAVLQIGRSLVRSQMVSLEFFIDIKSFRSHYGRGVDSASNRNEYQEHFLGVKAGGCVRLTTLSPSCAVVKKSGNLNFLEPSGPLQAGNGTAALPVPCILSVK